MIAALDVCYDDAKSQAISTAVAFGRWDAAAPTAEYLAIINNIQPYIPGEFFRRELPCLIAVIEKIKEPFNCLIVDGYVHLGKKPALGQYLFDHFHGTIPVIGVAKTQFQDAPAVEVLRGLSKSPLHITAIGIDPHEAANNIRKMHGPNRIPTLLKRVDRLGRDG